MRPFDLSVNDVDLLVELKPEGKVRMTGLGYIRFADFFVGRDSSYCRHPGHLHQRNHQDRFHGLYSRAHTAVQPSK